MSRKKWSPERRAAASAKARKQWERVPPEIRARRWEKSKAAFSAKYPHRVRISAEVRVDIQAGRTIPAQCDRGCGGVGQPVMRWDDEQQTGELVGWRCYDCRRSRRDDDAVVLAASRTAKKSARSDDDG